MLIFAFGTDIYLAYISGVFTLPQYKKYKKNKKKIVILLQKKECLPYLDVRKNIPYSIQRNISIFSVIFWRFKI